MQNKRLHTPEGVRDIYNDECEKKHYILDRMRQVIQSYGYRFIETPTFEFFDIFGQEVVLRRQKISINFLIVRAIPWSCVRI